MMLLILQGFGCFNRIRHKLKHFRVVLPSVQGFEAMLYHEDKLLDFRQNVVLPVMFDGAPKSLLPNDIDYSFECLEDSACYLDSEPEVRNK